MYVFVYTKQIKSYLFVGTHDEEVGEERGESGSETTLRHETKLHLVETDDLVVARPTGQVYAEALNHNMKNVKT